LVLHSLRRLAKVTALVLLAWTAIDLADPQCCLNERLGHGVTRISATTPADNASTNQTAVDDCFCCARCLDTGTRVPRLDVARVAADFDEPIQQPMTRPSTLDHPPQNA
jgi:hypothetical protein